MNFKKFLANQKINYNKFKKGALKLKRKGFAPSSKLSSPTNGVAVNFKHSLETSKKVEQFSIRVSQQVPAFVFKKEQIHTTIYFNPGKNLQKEYILQQFSEILDSLKGKLGNPCIEYKFWLINQSSLIAAGFPNRDLFNIINFFYKESKKRGIEFKFPWGAHITTNRFIKKGKFCKIPHILKMMKNQPPLGKSKIKSINIEEVRFNPKNYNLDYIPHKRRII